MGAAPDSRGVKSSERNEEMTRYLKALGLALLAVFATSAVAASGAQAAEFTGSEEGTHVHTAIKVTSESAANGGVQDFHYPLSFGGTAHLKCWHVTGQATSLTGTDSSLTASEVNYFGNEAEPTNEEATCEATSPLGVDVAHVDMNECAYVFHAGNKLKEGEYTGTVDIECAEGHEIDINITNGSGGTKCTIQVPGDETGAEPKNQGLSHVVYKNTTVNGHKVVTVETTVSSITYTTEGGLFNCGVGNGTHNNSTYEGNAIASGFNTDEEQIDAEVSGE